MNFEKPVKFGKYYLLDKIATGGMAELYRAKLTGAEGFEKLLAIKRILYHLNSEDKLVSSFIDEAKLAAILHHPNIVQIYDFGFMNETYYIAMEFLFGKDLRFTIKKALEKGFPIDFSNALYIVTQLLSGLDYAHTMHDFSGNPLKIIHRDIGPQNIFITYDGQVKIIDFGIAKAATQDTNTQAGTIKGKVSYMSPEQANGDTIDHRSDIFSAGIVMYELLTFRKMYEGDTFQILAKARKGLFEPAEKINSNLPGFIYDILNKALEKDPSKRYQTAEAMCRDIDSFMLNQSLRVSQRDLSVYMKSLFNGESDDFTIRTSILTEPDNVDGGSESTLVTREKQSGYKKIPVLKRINTRLSKKRMCVYGFAFVLALSLMVFAGGERGKARFYGLVDILSPTGTLPDISSDQEHITEGITALDKKKYREAIAVFEGVHSKNPASLKRTIPYYTQALSGLAGNMIESNPTKARTLLERSYSLNPENSSTCFLLGKSHTFSNENRKALEYYEKASRLDPDNPDIYFNMGYSFAVLDDYGKAKEMYGKVIDLAPPFVDQAYFNLAIIDDKIGRTKEAADNMKKALQLNPHNEDAARFLKNLKI